MANHFENKISQLNAQAESTAEAHRRQESEQLAQADARLAELVPQLLDLLNHHEVPTVQTFERRGDVYTYTYTPRGAGWILGISKKYMDGRKGYGGWHETGRTGISLEGRLFWSENFSADGYVDHAKAKPSLMDRVLGVQETRHPGPGVVHKYELGSPDAVKFLESPETAAFIADQIASD